MVRSLDKNLDTVSTIVVSLTRLELFADGIQLKDGSNQEIASFWIDRNMNRCEDNLMVTKSLKIKHGKIIHSSCKEKHEPYQCWREYKGYVDFSAFFPFQSIVSLSMVHFCLNG